MIITSAAVAKAATETGRCIMSVRSKTLKLATMLSLVAVCVCTPAFSIPSLASGEQGRVARVLDGDSFVLENGLVVRLASIEAPRLRSADRVSVASRDALTALVQGKTVQLQYGGLRRDSRGRALAHAVVTQEGGERLWVQEAMLEQGHARVHTYADNRIGVEDLWRAERLARRSSRGVWQSPAYQIRFATPEALGGAPNTFQIFEGRVISAQKRGSVIYLNFGTDQTTDVTATIPERSWSLWDGGEQAILTLQNRVIRIRGLVRNSNGPMVWVDHPEQVEYILTAAQLAARRSDRR
jgi:micrococcal nuclease